MFAIPSKAYRLWALCLGLWLGLGYKLGSSFSATALDPHDLDPAAQLALAQALNHQGQVALQRGQPQQALALWQQATTAYEQLEDQRGAIGTRLNQARALEELGQYRRACQTIVTTLTSIEDCNFGADEAKFQSALADLISPVNPVINYPLQIISLPSFGHLLRLLGQLDRAEEVLDQALTIAPDGNDRARIFLSLGQIKQAQYQRDQDLYQRTTFQPLGITPEVIKEHREEAVAFYDQAINLSSNSSPERTIRAQILRLKLLMEVRESSPAMTTLSPLDLEHLTDKIETQVLALKETQFTDLPQNRTTVYLRLNLAETFMHPSFSQEFRPEFRHRFRAVAEHHIQTAQQEATALDDHRAQSHSRGTLGLWYQQQENWQPALDNTQLALELARQLQSPELIYKWAWQLGRIYQVQGNLERAKGAYKTALTALDQVHQDLGTLDREIQFSFQDEVEPVYREFIDVLLEQYWLQQNSPDHSPDNQNLQQVIEVLDQLQVAELENFLNCDLSQILGPEAGDPEAERILAPETAVIHAIVQNNQLVVILETPKTTPESPTPEFPTPESQELDHHIDHHRVILDRTEVEALSKTLQRELGTLYLSPTGVQASQQLYNWLIKPFKSTLETYSIKTLIFTLDSPLRGIPMAALHNGEQYLIEEGYALALVPSLDLLKPTSPSSNPLEVLAFGLSEVRPDFAPHQNFAPLQHVETELAQIPSQILAEQRLNQDFTEREFETLVGPRAAKVVHLASHGQFSSVPEETFVLAWDKRLGIDDFALVLQQRTQQRPEAIELLILSACETAAGDTRATLGLAGIAIQSGARSTLASLWTINDRSTAILMKHFYQRLATPGISKAEALRQAQVQLMQTPGYSFPRFWASYILIGHWL
jgi:CHAT domain-containing protein